ncbi:MAG TPA: flagellar motor switch protein FliM [Acidobacteriaceae bacterium]
MDKVLDQSEIDSMFAAARADGASQSHAPADSLLSTPAPPERYNFGGSGQITRDQLQAVSAVNDLFARNLTHNLGAWLRSRFDVALVSAEQMTWSGLTSLLQEPAYLCSATLEPLDAIAALQLDLALAPAIVDLLLGGIGRPGTLREPTEIEDSILLSVAAILVRELTAAWRSVGLSFALDKRERDTQIAHLMSTSEKVLCVSFEVRMESVQGSINLCLPSVILNTLLRRANTERPRRRSADSRAHLQRLLGSAVFPSSLQFPPMRLNARALADLAPESVLPLPLPRQSTAELRVAGRPLFEAMPVRLGEHRGAQLKSLTVTPHESH